jgi:hypothetical protein
MAALVILIGALWWPALDGSFQFDDYVVILDNPRVHSLAAWLHSMPGIRPLLKLSYALDYSWSSEPRGFRLVNVAIHAANACLVGALLWRRARRHGLVPGAAVFATALATLVFALHPVQTEAVTYISGRSVSLAALCSLLSLACWLRGGDRHARPARLAWRGGALLVFIAAMGVRETAIVLPLALWLWNATEPRAASRQDNPSSAGARPRTPASIDWRGLAPFFVLALLAVAVVLAWPPYRFLIDTSLSIRSIGTNLLTQAHALGYLALQLLRPWNMNADPAFAATLQLDAATGLLVLLWAGILAAGLALRRRYPSVAFGLLWFFLWLAPTNSLLARHDIVNDRQLYLALIGPAWLLGYGLALAAQRQLLATTAAVRRVFLVVATLVVLALATLLATATMERNRVYATEVSFWEDVVRRTPENARAANNLGMAYAHACRDADATAQFRRAMRLQPDDHRAGVNLWLLRQGELIPETRTRACRHHDTATPAH